MPPRRAHADEDVNDTPSGKPEEVNTFIGQLSQPANASSTTPPPPPPEDDGSVDTPAAPSQQLTRSYGTDTLLGSWHNAPTQCW